MFYLRRFTVIPVVLFSLTMPIGVASSTTEVRDLVNPQKKSFAVPLSSTSKITQPQTSQKLNNLAPLKLVETLQIQVPTIPQIQIPKIPSELLQPQPLPQIPKIPSELLQPQPLLQIPKIPSELLQPKPQPLVVPPLQVLPTEEFKRQMDEINNNIRKFEQEEEKKRKKLEQEIQKQQTQQRLESQRLMNMERERQQREFEFLRRLPENLRREVQVAIGLHQIGKHTEALKSLQWIANAQRKNGGSSKDEGTTLTIISSIYNSLGRYSKALEICQQALAIQKQVKDQEGVSITLNYQGLIHYSLGQYSKAVNFYQQALTIAKESGYKSNESKILVNIGNVHIRQGNYPQAIELYEQSLAILKQINNQKQTFKFSESSSEEWFFWKYPINSQQQASELSESSMNNPHEISSLEGQVRSGIGEAYQKLGDYPKALELYQQALDIQKQINNKPGEGETLRKIGTVYDNQGKHSQALDYYQQALKIAIITNDKAEKAITLNNIGFIYNNQGKYLDAEKTLFAAVEAWESLRSGLSDDQKISIFEKQVTSYQFLQQALVAQNKTNLALEIAERGRTRAFVELLASKLHPNSNQTSIKPPNIKEIQKIAQQQSSTIVQYSIINTPFIKQGKEELRPLKLYLWVVKPTGEIIFKQVDLKSELDTSFTKLILKSRDLMRDRGRGISAVPPNTQLKNQDLNILQQLHQILIQPIASELPQNPNQPVIFVPQGELFLLPFPALQDDLGKYLIEKHTILTAPAIQVLQLTHQQKARNSKLTTKRPLVAGNPTMPSVSLELGEQPTRLPPLPGAEQETLQIAEILKTQPLIGSSATKASIKRFIETAGIIHLATHGLLDDIKGFGIPGAIALAPDGEDDGLLTSSEIFEMKLNADLVVLSACDTGRGDIKGDGVIGLSRSLIAAGAPSVIVSLWAVSDDSTKFLMTNFYQHLQQNPNKALALRSAMLTTMKKYPEPLNWAAFTLIGEAD